MRIVHYSDNSSEAWNNLCDESDEAWLFHRYEWIDIEARYFAQENLSFAITGEDHKVLGFQPLYLRQTD